MANSASPTRPSPAPSLPDGAADRPDRPARVAGTAAPGKPAARRSQRRGWLPPQHGAWGMLAVPFLLGVAASGLSWVHLPLLIAWYGGYLASYNLFAYVRVTRRDRYRAPLLTYGALTIVAGGIVLVAVPSVAWFGLLYAPLLALNVYYARRRAERSLVNDLLLVAEATLMAPVAYAVGVGGLAAADRGLAAEAALVAGLYLTGTVLHVKCMIRERGNPRYRWASWLWHALAVILAALVSPWLLIPFGFLLVRALVLPGRRVAIRTVGLVELVGTVLVVAFGIVAL